MEIVMRQDAENANCRIFAPELPVNVKT